MPQAQGNVVATKYVLEVTPGTTPATAMKLLNNTGTDIDGNINTTTSTTIRSDRATSDLVRTSGSSAGNINFETRFAEYNDFYAAALGGTWSTPIALSGTTFSTSSVDNSLNDSGAGFSTANILPGHWIRTKGFATAANNGLARVVSVTTTKVIVTGITFVTEAAGAAVTIKGSSVRNGAVKPTYSIERQFTDITQFAVSRGMVLNTMTLNAASGSILTGGFGFMGRDTEWAGTTFGTGSDVAASTNGVMSSTANVATVYEAGVATTTTYFKSINLSTNNNSRNLDAIGNLYAIDINHGSFNATAAIQAFFADRSLLDKFLNGTATSFSWGFVDDAGNTIMIDMPYAKFSAGKTAGVALNSDVMVDLTATALLSPTLGYMLQISTIPA